MKKIPVAVLGATGSVGQNFIELLQDHPWFEITALAASKRSAGKKYRDAANWLSPNPLAQRYGDMVVRECLPGLPAKLVFSGLDATVAGELETAFATAGYVVVSNAKNHRMEHDVPLMVPEINPQHLPLIKRQQFGRGFIITNPNCSTTGLVLALKPLHDNFGLESVQVMTMQALSGAGYPGVPSMDILDNVLPFIAGEEKKLESEPLKILGRINAPGIELETFKISAQCNRVALSNGHLENVSVKLSTKAMARDVIAAWKNFRSDAVEGLPSAPQRPLIYFNEENYPQPRLHRMINGGMTVSIGRLRPCPVMDFRFTLLVHNTIRGAAGGAILNAELLYKKGYLNEQ